MTLNSLRLCVLPILLYHYCTETVVNNDKQSLEKWRCKAAKRGIGSRPLFPDDCHLRTTFLKPYYIDIQTTPNKQDQNSQIAVLIFELFTNSYGLVIFFVLGIILGYMLKSGFKFRIKVHYFFVLLLLIAISVLYYSFSLYQ